VTDIDWGRQITVAVITVLAIQYGRWSQRRDDRKRAERERERRMAALLEAEVRRIRHRGA